MQFIPVPVISSHYSSL